MDDLPAMRATDVAQGVDLVVVLPNRKGSDFGEQGFEPCARASRSGARIAFRRSSTPFGKVIKQPPLPSGQVLARESSGSVASIGARASAEIEKLRF
jgi:hypothetical protein